MKWLHIALKAEYLNFTTHLKPVFYCHFGVDQSSKEQSIDLSTEIGSFKMADRTARSSNRQAEREAKEKDENKLN